MKSTLFKRVSLLIPGLVVYVLIGISLSGMSNYNSASLINALPGVTKAEGCSLISTPAGDFWCYCMQERDCSYSVENVFRKADDPEFTLIEGRLAI